MIVRVFLVATLVAINVKASDDNFMSAVRSLIYGDQVCVLNPFI